MCPYGSMKIPGRKGSGFLGSNPPLIAVKDEVEVPEANRCLKDPINVAAGHLETRKFVENAQAPYIACQLSMF
jgi:hypothetical protein